tara:strand:+ start:225 stop:503 length:279 start_codon:yes stop_codon:yes gene_type:complete
MKKQISLARAAWEQKKANRALASIPFKKITKPASRLRVGDILWVRDHHAEVVTEIQPYGSSLHSLLITTRPDADSFVEDKAGSVEVIISYQI